MLVAPLGDPPENTDMSLSVFSLNSAFENLFLVSLQDVRKTLS